MRCVCCLAVFLIYFAIQAPAQVIVFVPGKTTPYTSTATVATLAGVAAPFARLMGVAVAADGSAYVVDSDRHTICRVASTGVVTTLAGMAGAKGGADGQQAAACFCRPGGLAVGPDGSLYVADAENHTIRKITAGGEVTTLAGAAGTKGSTDGQGAAARFNLPHSVAVAADGTVYVADTFNHTIRKISSAGAVTTLAGTAGRKGSANGPGSVARFYHPSGVAVDAQGTLYVADNGNQTIRKITPDGIVTTLAGTAGGKGATDGPGSEARFRFPTGLAVDARGTLYVADFLNATIRKVTPTGVVTTLAGAGLHLSHADGPGSDARFEGPTGVAVDAQGTLYITDGTTLRMVK